MDPNSLALLMGSAGGVAAGPATYVEDVFSTWLYTGNGSTQTITNGINLSGKGGMVWIKGRSQASSDNNVSDTQRGDNATIKTNTTAAQAVFSSSFGIQHLSTGFTVQGDSNSSDGRNNSGETYASWTFREAAKFFDVVTYTGDGSNRTVAHSLGSVPGAIIVKRTDTAADWQVYHRSIANTEYMVLNSTAAKATGTTRWNSTTPTSTVFSLGTDTTVNANGGTYIAYLFAHDAGGFGDSGNDNVVSCGSYTNNSSQAVEVNLGWEPQWVLVKNASGSGDWIVADTMRGIAVTQSDTGGGTGPSLSANSANAESATGAAVKPTSTGFKVQYNVSSNQNSAATTGTVTYIYIAIRRGPMKTPTDATKVFGLNARTGTGANATVTGGQIDDAALIKNRGSAVGDLFAARLTGTNYLETSSTAGEVGAGTTILQANPWDVMNGIKVGTTSTITNASSNTFINYLFRRAPGFFDVVAYTGTGGTQTLSHALATQPQLIIIKNRDGSPGVTNWMVSALSLSAPSSDFSFVARLNTTDAFFSNSSYFTLNSPTASSFYIATNAGSNGVNYIAYLFASCPGVSKVGSYTGTGTTLSVDCGFTNGARFILIKRTDSTGDWYVWDTARGIVSGDDPYLLLNSTAAEVTNTDYIDPLNAGFQISSTAPAAINANGGSFIYLAIA